MSTNEIWRNIVQFISVFHMFYFSVIPQPHQQVKLSRKLTFPPFPPPVIIIFAGGGLEL